MTTLIESRTNRLGIEIRHETTPRGAERLRAYRNGRIVAERELVRCGGRPLASSLTVIDSRVTRADLVEVEAGLNEGLRVLRDGRGLCEAA